QDALAAADRRRAARDALDAVDRKPPHIKPPLPFEIEPPLPKDRDYAVRDAIASADEAAADRAAATAADPLQTWPPESDRYQNAANLSCVARNRRGGVGRAAGILSYAKRLPARDASLYLRLNGGPPKKSSGIKIGSCIQLSGGSRLRRGGGEGAVAAAREGGADVHPQGSKEAVDPIQAPQSSEGHPMAPEARPARHGRRSCAINA
ncbi:hypothetical protein THAOC_22983, partial [Thalassiosira oceanica]